jgi:hypothetical protein
VIESFAERVGNLVAPLTTNGYQFTTDAAHFGELRESSDLLGDRRALGARMGQDGYLFLRRYLPREQVLGVRRELVEKLATMGLIDRRYPLLEARYSGNKAELDQMDPGARAAMSRDLRGGPALRALCQQGPLIEFFEAFLSGSIQPIDKILIRNVRVGSATPVHFDWVYFTQGTANLYTTWIPIGDVPLSDGPLLVLEGSHKIEELRSGYGQLDAFRDGAYTNKDHPYFEGFLTKDAPAVQQRFGTRWLTTEFQAGDVLIFGMFTLHCSLDNKSPENRVRLSIDARYQHAADPIDRRWMGEEDRFGEGMD